MASNGGNTQNSTGWFQYLATEIGKIWNTITQSLNIGSNAITTTNYNIQEVTDSYDGQVISIQRNGGNNISAFVLEPSGTEVTASLDVHDSSDDANTGIGYVSKTSAATAPFDLGTTNQGTGTAGPVRIRPNTAVFVFGTDGSLTMQDAGNFIFNATTGTKIGTAASQKLAFYNATPIAQQTGVAVTAAAIHAALVNLGLITA